MRRIACACRAIQPRTHPATGHPHNVRTLPYRRVRAARRVFPSILVTQNRHLLTRVAEVPASRTTCGNLSPVHIHPTLLTFRLTAVTPAVDVTRECPHVVPGALHSAPIIHALHFPLCHVITHVTNQPSLRRPKSEGHGRLLTWQLPPHVRGGTSCHVTRHVRRAIQPNLPAPSRIPPVI